MRIFRLAALTVVFGIGARAGQPKRTIEEKVTVYLENDANVPPPVLSRARTLAAEMFATGVGVRIDLRGPIAAKNGRETKVLETAR
jgi:hypothetical protein